MNISVIIPVYNAEKYVRKAVESALQFEEVKEVILIEDGSPDNALEVCRQLVKEDSRVKLLTHPNGENRGAGETRNLGLKNATCEYIAFLDADDYYLPNRFDKDKEIFANTPDAEGVCNAIGSYFYSDKAKELYLKRNLEITTYKRKDLCPENYFETLVLDKGFTSLDGITLKRESLSKTDLFDVKLKQTQDTDFIMNLAINLKIYPSSMDIPVSMRGVHEENRIHNQSEAKIYSGYMYEKWLKKSKNFNWSQKIMHKLFYRCVVGQSELLSLSRRIVAIKLLLKYPHLLTKLNPKDLYHSFYSAFK